MTRVVPVRMPKLTMAAIEATFVEWLVADGERVVEEQPLCTLASDKAETELPAPATGVLRHGSVEPEEVYAVSTELATIEVSEADQP
jgi:2-oxoglutarate dehydrogenase E2 component (dihydrolipoamide succinyltransferase)